MIINIMVTIQETYHVLYQTSKWLNLKTTFMYFYQIYRAVITYIMIVFLSFDQKSILIVL